MSYLELYHTDNGIFDEQPFISSIEDDNQTITFFGVGYHYQNATVEIKNKNITLVEARILLLHANVFWAENLSSVT